MNSDINKDRLMVAYCGLFCKSCFLRRQRIADLASDLLTELGTIDINRIFCGMASLFEELQPIKNPKQIQNTLRAMTGLRCSGPCRDGGGSEDCQIRKCCVKRGLKGCWLCDQLEQCPHLDWLKPVNADNARHNLKVIAGQGIEAFLAGEKRW